MKNDKIELWPFRLILGMQVNEWANDQQYHGHEIVPNCVIKRTKGGYMAFLWHGPHLKAAQPGRCLKTRAAALRSIAIKRADIECLAG